MPHRCVFGCKETNVPVHCFPNPEKFPERFKIWVSLVGGKLDTASDYEFFKNKRICDLHFIEAHRNRFKRLNALAVPTLHLPELPRSQQSLDNSAAKVPTANAGPSSTSLKDINDIVAPFPNAVPLGEKKAAAAIVNEHNYSVISRRKHSTSNDAPRKTCPAGTLLTKPLHKQVRYLRTEVCRLRKKAKSLKQRLHNAEKLNSNVAFQRVVKSMTKPAQ